MIRALIVDDEPLARSRMSRLLAAHPDVEVVGEASSGNEAVRQCLALRPNLVLLDVDMPDGSGLDALAAIRETMPDDLAPWAVFTTAHAEHAVTAFALEGLDYLLKPVEPPDLARALKRVRKRVWAPGAVPPGPLSPAPTAPLPAPESEAPVASGHLAAHRGGRVLSLAIEDVALVELEDTIAFAYTAQGRHRLSGTLAEVEARLPTPTFVRVSRAAVIQVAWIGHLEPLGAGVWLATLKPPVDREVRVARRRVKPIRELLGW